ncbi:DUF1569 domain-containing protein [Flammeovirga sp. MY04]|uniref:DUF1569 domain-containing protein n=1 Tax=Flammeovirga sp. MY04 TaxID=1191459 RepID=UPI00080617A8|nr:DUF1569 domain-containing protein [Flammeovirga sp. MY04]ANQ52434.1 DUF1569 domain-containing protein [Flammeovirga sp. MY04]
MTLLDQINQLVIYTQTEAFRKTVPSVSKAGVDWHVYHSILSMNLICEALINSNPEQYQSVFNIKWWIIKLIKKMPRGKARAPKYVNNFGNVDLSIVEMELDKGYQLIEQIDTLSENHYFRHFVFGELNVKEAKKMMIIHTNHHIKIIQDILKS